MSYRKELGKRGEDLAAAFLEENGFAVTARNVHVSHDEIDIIAEDPVYIVFAEVKTRAQTTSNMRFGRPAAAVNFTKQQKMIRAAEEYLRQNPVKKQPRLDVIEVYFPPIHEDTPVDIFSLRAVGIKHIRNAVKKA